MSALPAPSSAANTAAIPADGFDQASAIFAAQAEELCEDISTALGETFEADPWQSALGQGIVRRASEGPALEAGSVNYSEIGAEGFPAAGAPDGAVLEGSPYRACGLSLIMHPGNPFAPSSHLNVRLLVVEPEKGPSQWWFGGGFDLTPYLPFDEDCVAWHEAAERLCQPYGDDVYATFKRQCDEYFHLPHRGETRGVGGIFFDRLSQWGWPSCLEFASALAPTWRQAWLEIAERRRDTPFDERHREFQLYRRGRYVEFNLLYDRGTLFGLNSGGRTENILVSMPPRVRWGYRLDEGDFADLSARLKPYLRARAWLAEDLPPSPVKTP